MPLLTNRLTFKFNRSIRWTDDGQVPEVLEVAVIPLSNPSFPDQGTFVGGLQVQEVLLTDETNTISFQLVPSYAPGLTEPVLYRAEWREGGLTGRVFSEDFAMPASDVDFDQLASMGNVIDGQIYVQQSQVGVASGVAALNADGNVVDFAGIPVAEQSDISLVHASIAQEVLDRRNAITSLSSTFSTSLAEDIGAEVTNRTHAINDVVATLNNTASSNYNTLNNAITAEAAARSSAVGATNATLTTLSGRVDNIDTALASTATLTGGVLSSSQIPPQLLLFAYKVSGQAGMLALSRSTNNGNLPPVHYADIAIWNNGAVWMLLGDPNNPVVSPDPSMLGNWQNLTTVYSVNGLTGNVTLTPQIIGAVGNNGSSGSVTQAQVQGLSSTLATYTPLASYNTLNTTVAGILSNTNIVYLDTSGPSAGHVNHAKLDAGVAYVNNLSQVTLKDGTVIASGTGTILSINGYEGPNVTLTATDVGAYPVGGSIPESAVVGLLADLAARVLSSDARLTNARTPVAHASSHGAVGSDPVTLTTAQITGLDTALSNKAALTTVTTQANQIADLQNSVTFLLGGGTPSSSPIKAIWFDGISTVTGITNPSDFQTVYNVAQKSPFGKSISDGTFYYNPAGANAGEWVYPYITPNGHLQLRTWNEAGAADTVFATATQLSSLSAQVSTLATTASLNALQTQVLAKANQSSVDTINAQLPTFATITALNSLTTQVGNKANQGDLNTTNAAVALKADASTVSALTTTVGGLATQSALNSLQSVVTANGNTLALKADLSGPGVTVPLNQLPSLPESQVTNLVTDLSNKAPLVSGKVPLNNLPNLPESQVTNLLTDLSNKADLVNGQIPTSQLPALQINQVFTEPNRASMLAISTANVGDICVITGTTDQGTYILSASPASTFSNWVLLPISAAVSSVNGATGAVNLTAANVGAIAIGQAIPISQITNLQPTLNTFATTTALNSAVAPLQSLAQVQGTLTTSTFIKQAVNYVATTAISSLAGQQSIDGVLTPLGSLVLATAQPSSTNNGPWIVQSGSWTRPSDFATNSYFVRGTIIFVQNGTTLANTIWQETTNSGVVDTNANNWSLLMTAGGPITYTAGNGITKSANAFSVNAVVGGGLSVTSAGVSVDTGIVVRKYAGFVPSGATVATVNHGLNSTDVASVMIRENASGNQVLAGVTVTGPNTLTVEFASAPATNQFRIVVTV